MLLHKFRILPPLLNGGGGAGNLMRFSMLQEELWLIRMRSLHPWKKKSKLVAKMQTCVEAQRRD